MNTVSASSYDISSNPTKRKRGRPKKDEASGSDSTRRAPRSPSSNVEFVGQEVSGFFVGVFDTGYLLTVQVGSSGPIMSGLVFDPRLSVPISAENDIAPHLPMLGRNDSSPPIEEDFFNRGAISSQDDVSPKNLIENHVPQALQPAKTLRIFLEGAAIETPSHLQSQTKNEDSSISAGKMDISMSSNGHNPSVVSMETSFEASKSVPVNVSMISDTSEEKPQAAIEPLDIPKEAPLVSTDGLPFRIAPSDAFTPLEASVTSQKVNLDEASREVDNEVRQILEHRTEETRGMVAEVEPSEDQKVDDSLADCNGMSEIPITAVEDKQEDDSTFSEASIFQP